MKFLAFATVGCLLFASDPAADADLQPLQGKWIVESFDYNGNPVEIMKGAVREFKEEKYTLAPMWATRSTES